MQFVSLNFEVHVTYGVDFAVLELLSIVDVTFDVTTSSQL